MKDDNFLREMNARHLWHPMGHPGDMQVNAPTIIKEAHGVEITDLDGHTAIDAVEVICSGRIFHSVMLC